MEQQVYSRLKSAFKGIRFSKELDQKFSTLWTPKYFKRGQFITEAGEAERHFYFILEGVQMIYLIDNKGEKVVIGFSYGGNFSGVYDSFLSQKPSDYFLETLTSTKLLALPLFAYLELFEQYPQFDKWGRIFHQEILTGRVKREVEILTLPAKDRYINFMRRCPEPLLKIPQKYIASYLNMKPETFSRLRASVRY